MVLVESTTRIYLQGANCSTLVSGTGPLPVPIYAEHLSSQCVAPTHMHVDILGRLK